MAEVLPSSPKCPKCQLVLQNGNSVLVSGSFENINGPRCFSLYFIFYPCSELEEICLIDILRRRHFVILKKRRVYLKCKPLVSCVYLRTDLLCAFFLLEIVQILTLALIMRFNKTRSNTYYSQIGEIFYYLKCRLWHCGHECETVNTKNQHTSWQFYAKMTTLLMSFVYLSRKLSLNKVDVGSSYVQNVRICRQAFLRWRCPCCSQCVDNWWNFFLIRI